MAARRSRAGSCSRTPSSSPLAASDPGPGASWRPLPCSGRQRASQAPRQRAGSPGPSAGAGSGSLAAPPSRCAAASARRCSASRLRSASARIACGPRAGVGLRAWQAGSLRRPVAGAATVSSHSGRAWCAARPLVPLAGAPGERAWPGPGACEASQGLHAHLLRPQAPAAAAPAGGMSAAPVAARAPSRCAPAAQVFGPAQLLQRAGAPAASALCAGAPSQSRSGACAPCTVLPSGAGARPWMPGSGCSGARQRRAATALAARLPSWTSVDACSGAAVQLAPPCSLPRPLACTAAGRELGCWPGLTSALRGALRTAAAFCAAGSMRAGGRPAALGWSGAACVLQATLRPGAWRPRVSSCGASAAARGSERAQPAAAHTRSRVGLAGWAASSAGRVACAARACRAASRSACLRGPAQPLQHQACCGHRGRHGVELAGSGSAWAGAQCRQSRGWLGRQGAPAAAPPPLPAPLRRRRAPSTPPAVRPLRLPRPHSVLSAPGSGRHTLLPGRSGPRGARPPPQHPGRAAAAQAQAPAPCAALGARGARPSALRAHGAVPARLIQPHAPGFLACALRPLHA